MVAQTKCRRDPRLNCSCGPLWNGIRSNPSWAPAQLSFAGFHRVFWVAASCSQKNERVARVVNTLVCLEMFFLLSNMTGNEDLTWFNHQTWEDQPAIIVNIHRKYPARKIVGFVQKLRMTENLKRSKKCGICFNLVGTWWQTLNFGSDVCSRQKYGTKKRHRICFSWYSFLRYPTFSPDLCVAFY